MGPCNAPSFNFGRPVVCYSLQAEAVGEAERYRWIESQKAGRDLGIAPMRDWVSLHWRGFLRARWVEHLEGHAFWIELDHADFGLLQREFLGCELMREILGMVKKGGENLDILNWAREKGRPMDRVIAILDALNINSRRIECQLVERLSQYH